MTSRERMNVAMRHGVPDRVPVMCQLALGHYFLHSGRAPSDIWFDTETFVRVLAEFQQRYRFDGFLINLPGRPTDWKGHLSHYEHTSEGERLTWQSGLVTNVPANDNPHTFTATGNALPHADYNNIDPADPAILRTPGYVWNTWHAPTLWDIPETADLTDAAAYPDWLTRGLRIARAAFPDVSIHAEIFAPFTHLMELFGYQNALMALIDEPDICHSLLGLFARMAIAQVDRWAAETPDAILISSAFAGAGFISRSMYREFVMPYERQVVRAIRQHAIPSYVHTCGAIGDRLDLMSETEVDGIDTLDPPPLGTVDLAQAKTQYGETFFFKGNLDAVNEMLRADDEGFDLAVRRRLEIGAPGGGYILSSACSVAPYVKPQRLIRMAELAEQFR